MKEKGYGRVATVMGRFYAMDRDKRWDRVKEAFDAMVRSQGFKATSGVNAVEQAYARGETDEFVKPTVVVNGGGEPVARVKDGDALVFFNFRADRAREITRAFMQADFKDFDASARPRLSAFAGMAQYDETFDLPAAFPPEQPTEIFPEIVSRAGLKQLRCAETEKYAHVTFFFNGGRETVFPGEDRVLVPSPRDVKTYDEKPEMSAREVTDKVVEAVRIEALRLHPRQLRQPRHGGAHRQARRRGEGGEGGRRVHRAALGGGAGGRAWRSSSPPTTATAR